ncbi:MAG: cell division topological specificity factor MinE [bacterium]|nr:cell division topological specificity factor MinE [bacterium]
MLRSLTSKFFGPRFSKRTAKNRLQMLLVQDRSGLSSADMDLFKKDLMEVISKYFELEGQDLNIEWQRTDSSTALMINTPVVGKTPTKKAA